MSEESELDVLLVVGGSDTHDYDYLRPELIRLVTGGRDVRIDVRPDFSDLGALGRTRRLLSYTCDVRPAPAEEEALEHFVDRGGRWLALHSTNALFDLDPPRVVTGHERFLALLGSKFLSHPPIHDFGVRVAAGPVAQQLLRGVPEFTTSDELYLLEQTADVEVLLEVGGTADRDGTPLAYLRRLGAGQVLYCSLGHAGPPTAAQAATRCSWPVPEYRLILDRATEWLL